MKGKTLMFLPSNVSLEVTADLGNVVLGRVTKDACLMSGEKVLVGKSTKKYIDV